MWLGFTYGRGQSKTCKTAVCKTVLVKGDLCLRLVASAATGVVPTASSATAAIERDICCLPGSLPGCPWAQDHLCRNPLEEQSLREPCLHVAASVGSAQGIVCITCQQIRFLADKCHYCVHLGAGGSCCSQVSLYFWGRTFLPPVLSLYGRG